MDMEFDALLIVGFGGPQGPDDVIPFLQNTVRGRAVPEERLLEVAQHYARYGGVSPINAQLRALAEAVSDRLKADGADLPVYLGNRNWHPYLADTVSQMREHGVNHALAFFTSPYSSYSSCRQYLDDIERARNQVGTGAPQISRLRHYFNHPGFIEPMADQVRSALGRIDVARRESAALVFTAHSIPTAMASGCDYQRQLEESCRLITELAWPGADWNLVWQSRSGSPRIPWLEPQIDDELRRLAVAGVRDVIVVPVGFISDHIEVLFDLDVEAAQVAAELGLTMVRCPTVGTAAGFVQMVQELVRERSDGAAPRWLGSLGPRPVPCAAGCCPADTASGPG